MNIKDLLEISYSFHNLFAYNWFIYVFNTLDYEYQSI